MDPTIARSKVLSQFGLVWDGAQYTYPKAPQYGINFHYTDIICMGEHEFQRALHSVKGIIKEACK